MEDKNVANFYLENPISKEEALNMLPMSLAFIGDSVQTLYVRTRVTIGSNVKTGLLHKEVTDVVKAVSQADAVEKLLPKFNEEEADIFRRARNCKIQTSAKHAEIAQYRYASGFEAVLGYLFVTGQKERLAEVLDFSFEIESNK
ncbi:MAG: Mini-ribonuclease 3 [Clostridia bacterium]|nr:Mini-ribonuclease 3 [Clostridia bacterium]